MGKIRNKKRGARR